MQYPKEWPGCEVVSDGTPMNLVRAGAIVELIERPHRGLDWRGREVLTLDDNFGVRVVTDELATGDCPRHPIERWPGAILPRSQLRPLTRSARERLR